MESVELNINDILDRLSQQIGKLSIDITLKDLQILNLQKELEKLQKEIKEKALTD